MQQIVTTPEMISVDEATINGNIDVGYQLMKEAAEGLAGEIIKSLKGDIRKKIAIICGKGNNGGDGFLSGAILLANGYLADCFLISKENDLRNEALLAFNEFKNVGTVHFISKEEDLNILSEYYLIVDSLLGTGSKGAPRGFISDIIRKINTFNKKVIAVDTPSGLNSDTGEVYDPCIVAEKTVTLGFFKVGQFYYPAKNYTGKVKVVNLSYPLDIINRSCSKRYLISLDDIKLGMPKRISDGSKYDHGVVGVVAGSKGMTGAPVLAMKSAMRAGCGMVHGFIPEHIFDIISIKVTEPVLHSIINSEDGSLSLSGYDDIIKNLKKVNSLLIGPGLSLNKETLELIRKLLSCVEMPIVLDADGLNAFKGCVELLLKRDAKLIITPHKDEFERLFGILPKKPEKIIDLCCSLANKYNMVIILKGKPTIISDGEKSFIVDKGDNSLATAGTGDVLSGIIASLIAQGASIIDSAVVGAYIHGLAGRIASKKYSIYSVIASDVCESIGKAYKEILMDMES